MVSQRVWPRRLRRAGLTGALLGLTAVVVLMLVPVPATGTAAGVSGYVVETNRGPLTACAPDLTNCGPANTVWFFIHLVNAKPLTNHAGGTNRATLPNTFVIESVDQEVFVDGVPHPQFPSFHFVPPPNAVFPGYSGHWPATVRCGGGPPCLDVTNPAVLPGENTVALYVGWIHAENEPDGKHVFRYTVHGTLNGVPTDVVAVSSKISMTH